jgi:hypothetical protein
MQAKADAANVVDIAVRLLADPAAVQGNTLIHVPLAAESSGAENVLVSGLEEVFKFPAYDTVGVHTEMVRTPLRHYMPYIPCIIA